MSALHGRTLLLLWLSIFPVSLPAAVETFLGEWTDPARERTIPYRVYHASGSQRPQPVVLFSHGLGGTRDAAEYLGRAWAEAGYVCVFLQHPGSDAEVWRGGGLRPGRVMEAMRRAASDPANLVHRPLDVTFAIDQLARMNEEGILRGRLDLERIALAGHSFGAYTALAVAGLRLGPAGRTFEDPRVRCALVLSAPPPRLGRDLDAHYGGIRIPVLIMTGTEDTSPLDAGRSPQERQLVFEHARAADRSLVVFQNADHVVFSGRRRDGPSAKDALLQAGVVRGTCAFLDWQLRGDEEARGYLLKGEYARELGVLAARYAWRPAGG